MKDKLDIIKRRWRPNVIIVSFSVALVFHEVFLIFQDDKPNIIARWPEMLLNQRYTLQMVSGKPSPS
jgi:hypothetical protein